MLTRRLWRELEAKGSNSLRYHINLFKEKTSLYISRSDGGADGFACSVVRVEDGIAECQASFSTTGAQRALRKW